MIGLQIPKVIFKTRVGDSSSSLNECSIGGKWVDKSTDDYFNGKRVVIYQTDEHDPYNGFKLFKESKLN